MQDSTVFIIDGDPEVRDTLSRLLESVGLRVRTLASAAALLQVLWPEMPGCLLLDVRIPHMSGLELQQTLVDRGYVIPIIFLTAHADVPTAVRSMKAGAFDFFEKPFRSQLLLERVQQAILHDRAARSQLAALRTVTDRWHSMTAREREVTGFVVEGFTSKQIADRLGLSPKTIHAHRAEAMAKLHARSIAELTRLVVSARLLSRPMSGGGAPRSGSTTTGHELSIE